MATAATQISDERAAMKRVMLALLYHKNCPELATITHFYHVFFNCWAILLGPKQILAKIMGDLKIH